MDLPKVFVPRVLGLAAERLAAVGFQKRGPQIFTTKLSENVLGWVGLNKAVSRGVLEINAVVGVRHQELERLVAEALGQKPSQYIPASVGTNVGYLMPERRYRPWLFQEGHDCEPVLTDMVKAIETFGRPFMQRNANLSTLRDTMQALGIAGQLEYRLPAASALLGKTTEAEAFLRMKLTEMGNRNDMAAETFRRFASGLRRALPMSPGRQSL